MHAGLSFRLSLSIADAEDARLRDLVEQLISDNERLERQLEGERAERKRVERKGTDLEKTNG